MKNKFLPLMIILIFALAACGGDTGEIVESAQNVAEDVVESVEDEIVEATEEAVEEEAAEEEVVEEEVVEEEDVAATEATVGCYWLSNVTGEWEAQEGTTFDQCYALDSCSGGLGESGGGCYKWSDQIDSDAYPWDASGEANLPSESWAGSTVIKDGGALADVAISINGIETQSGADGTYGLSVPVADDGRYLINAEQDGYLPLSIIHVGSAPTELTLEFKPVETFIVDPTQPIDTTDSRGTNISIEPNSLVDADGNPATEDLMLSMYTYDLTNEEMVGDMSGTNTEGEEVYMESAGAFYAEFEDDTGNEYNLADGAEAEISIPVEEERPAEVLTVWSYNPETGLWEEEGEAELVDGRYEAKVSHFSSWNFDWEKSTPACIKLEIAPDYLAANTPVQIRAILQTNPVTVRDMSITDQASGLYNLPTNTEVKFYLSPDYATPFTTANSGAPWGGVGVPASPYDVCKGVAEIAPAPVPGIIQGIKFQDTNNNGVRDSGEPGLPGWTIEIRDSADNLNSFVTDDEGNYQATLLADDYTISEVQQDGWTQTQPASGSHAVSVKSGSSITDIDFGNHFENSCSVPLDIVFVIDVTGSMGGAIDGVKGELDKILNDISGTSGGDYQLGLVTFSDDVFVLNDLQANNLSAIKENIRLLTANGGGSIPEASDEALNTVINGLAERDNQTGNFSGNWRPNARKHIILVTNAVPGGFDDAYGDADKTNAEALAQAAQNSGIKIDAIQVPGDNEAVMIMQNYADVSGGTYVLTNESGSNAASEILNIITECASTGTIEGQVTDAVSGNPIPNVQVCIQGTPQCVDTDTNGNYTISDVAPGEYLLNLREDGYIPVNDQSVIVTVGETAPRPMAMSAELAEGELRIVLTWGDNPRDLDSYLLLPDATLINYEKDDPNNTAQLDLDDTDGNGPETITILQQVDGTYTFAVHNFTVFSDSGTTPFATSGAVVRVYRGDQEIGAYAVESATGDDGVWWYVFAMDGATGNLTEVNTLSVNGPG